MRGASRTIIVSFCLLAVLTSRMAAQQLVPSDEPWEAELPREASASAHTEYQADTSFSPLRLLVRAGIGLYRDHVSRHSVSRCPFAVSCSRFAAEAVERHGAAGLLLFIDRYFFREHAFAFTHYPLRLFHGGYLKLDDTLYHAD